MINQAQRAVQVKLNGVALKKWATTSSPSVTNATWAGYNVCYISVPTDFLEGDNAINATTTQAGVTGKADEIKSQDFEETLRNSYTEPTTKYPVMTRMDNRFYFYPRVSSMTFRYYKRVPNLSSDGDISEIPLEYHDMIVSKVVSEIKKIKAQQQYVLEDRQLDKDIEDAFVKKQRNQEAKDDTNRN